MTTPPLRVLCVTPFGPSGRGGIDRLYLYLRELIGADCMAGVDLRFARSRGSAAGNRWIATFPLVLAELARQLWAFRPHVVHINFATGGSLPRKYLIQKLAKAFGAKTVVHFHGQFIEDKIVAGTPAGRLFARLATRADRVIALGAVHASAFRRIGVDASRISTVANGIPDFAGDEVLPKPKTEQLGILFSGLLTENKGMQILIPALAQLDEQFRSWHCTVAGNGEIERFSNMARDAGLSDKMTFTGWIEADTMHRHMALADVVVLPSRTEALPLSLIEGACAGAALLATDVGNVRDIVHDGINGRLVPRDPAGIATALLTLARNRDHLSQMQSASRRIYREQFTLAAFAASLRTVYIQTAA